MPVAGFVSVRLFWLSSADMPIVPRPVFGLESSQRSPSDHRSSVDLRWDPSLDQSRLANVAVTVPPHIRHRRQMPGCQFEPQHQENQENYGDQTDPRKS